MENRDVRITAISGIAQKYEESYLDHDTEYLAVVGWAHLYETEQADRSIAHQLDIPLSCLYRHWRSTRLTLTDRVYSQPQCKDLSEREMSISQAALMLTPEAIAADLSAHTIIFPISLYENEARLLDSIVPGESSSERLSEETMRMFAAETEEEAVLQYQRYNDHVRVLPDAFQYADDERAKMLDLMIEGLSLGEIAECFNIQEGVLRNKLRNIRVTSGFNDLGEMRRALAQYYKSEDTNPLSALTKKEMNILELASEGYHPKEIAHFLSMSYGTVTQHFHRLYKKLDASSRQHATDIYRNSRSQK